MSNYKQTFGIRSRHKRSKTVKSEKGDPSIGFKRVWVTFPTTTFPTMTFPTATFPTDDFPDR